MINYARRDVHYLGEQVTMLENQNHFLESEFQRQLDKIVQEKNEQISRLIHIIDQSCTTNHNKEQILQESYSTGKFALRMFIVDDMRLDTADLLKKFQQENVELQREIETLRAKLEYTFTTVNEKLDQQQTEVEQSSTSPVQKAFEQLQDAQNHLQEWKLKSEAQQEENDLLKYLVNSSNANFGNFSLFCTFSVRKISATIVC